MMASSLPGACEKQRHALVVCDIQPDSLQSLDRSTRDSVLDSVRIAIDVTRRAGWTTVLTGLRFPSRYEGVSPTHMLYGALKRLNAKLGGDANAHWFMEGYEGSEMESSLLKKEEDENNIVILWRQSHLPSPQLMDELQSRSISKATVVGIKAGYAIQATVQALCDAGIQVTVVQECVSDDNSERLQAVMQHIVPIYANASSLAELVDETVGLTQYAKIVAAENTQKEDPSQKTKNNNAFYCSDCKRGGHMALYASYLLQKLGWRSYPLQDWYSDDFAGKQYTCPLGKRVVDFCDEPQFSQVSMYLKGREWLDEKEKVIGLAGTIMPETYVIEHGAWVMGRPPSDDDNPESTGPWFVKECDKNGGRSIQICHNASECMALADPSSSYVVQAHIVNPLLTDKGQKCHVKFYTLLQCDRDGVSWQLHTYQDAFLCISPNPWRYEDVSKETQITIKRHKRMLAGHEMEGWKGWPAAYDKCKECVATVVEKAISKGKLCGRPDKKQFEIFSADFMLDTSGKAWLIEFNFGPVLFDPLAGQDLTTAGLKEYQRLYEIQGEKAEVNDRAMICDALDMIFFPEEAVRGGTSRWDPAGSFQGEQ